MTEISKDDVLRSAIGLRRGRFERTRRLSCFDETMPPTEGELDDARAAIETFLAGSSEYRRGFTDAKNRAANVLVGLSQVATGRALVWTELDTIANEVIRALQPTER